MGDFLDVLARDVKETIHEGYYETLTHVATPSVSLKKTILESKNIPIITEIKAASPSLGTIRKNFNPEEVAGAMENGGAVGISVLTEPKHFKGSLDSFVKVRKRVRLPLLMKDVIIHPMQLETASKIGANAVLLIATLFKRGYSTHDSDDMISLAHSKNLEVLLETHTKDEFLSALKTRADLIGINNRDLRTLKVDLKITQRILTKIDNEEKVVISESGIRTPADIRFLRQCGAHGFLVGSALMAADDIERKVRELVRAL